MKEEIIFSNPGEICEPRGNISDKRVKGKWCSYRYETAKFSGSMLVSMKTSEAEDVELSPELAGWYRIYVGLYSPAYEQTELEMKLSSEQAFMRLGTAKERGWSEHTVEEVFWRCARLDGEKIVIGKHGSQAYGKTSAVAWIRVEKMTDGEVEEYIADKNRTDTKRLYATNDMHVMLCKYDMSRENAWKNVVQDYADSDVEWLAVESLAQALAKPEDCGIDDFAFGRDIDEAFARQTEFYSDDVLKEINAYGKERGLKMCVSWRLAMWGGDFPFDRVFFEKDFAKENPQFRCVDRDGDVTEYMSFMYPEVRERAIDEFVRLSHTGCDAVQVLFSRGWPYILFEKPFLDKFSERYGEDARVLPLDDERIVGLKCEIMTEFMRELRSRMNSDAELHAKVLFSVYDCALVGLDVKTWAKEGIVDRIVSDERRIREILPEEIFENGRINLEKYTRYANESVEPPIRYDYDSVFAPERDSKGVLRGPKSQRERIEEFVELEKYGMTVYIEIMPRLMAPDKIKEKALEIYDAGCNHIGLWDTYERVGRKLEWNMWRRIGHKDELADFGNDGMLRVVRLTKIGDKNVRNYKSVWGA